MSLDPDTEARGGWLRPLSDKEEYFAVGHQMNCFQTNYCLHLSTTHTITHQILNTALTHLYNQVPVLRLRMGQRDGRLWFKKMDTCNLDLKVLHATEVNKTEEELINHVYNTEEGPLWCVRLLSGQCKESDHQYKVMLGVHHSVADGFTNIIICNLLHKILDDIMAGESVSDEDQFGQHVDGQMADDLYHQEKQKLLQDPQLLANRREKLVNGTITRPHLLDVFPIQQMGKAVSCSAKIELDENSTEAFRKKCKDENVTFHSGVTGVINAAMVNIMEETGKGLQHYNFACSHDISLRRYYKGDTSATFGPHLPLFSFKYPFTMSKDIMTSFWTSIKVFHNDFHSELRGGAPLQAVAIRLIDKSKAEIFKDYFRESGDPPEYYYAISNLRDITSLVPGDGSCVKVTDVERFSSIRANATIMCFFVHTYSHRLKVSLAYSSRYMSNDTADKLLSKMKDLFTVVCHL